MEVSPHQEFQHSPEFGIPPWIPYSRRRFQQVVINDSQNLDQIDTITFPISGENADRYYQTSYKLMPLVGSPGVAFIGVDKPPGTYTSPNPPFYLGGLCWYLHY
ncbi:unnamed protein product [Porites lobata]|uniref:Uncharacterized protein n=1 Tax=Porites lobata TaxID=104759 RepID=A0ABN8RYI3_9CNID|nr:unnamed protein product [Porites lobata]